MSTRYPDKSVTYFSFSKAGLCSSDNRFIQITIESDNKFRQLLGILVYVKTTLTSSNESNLKRICTEKVKFGRLED